MEGADSVDYIERYNELKERLGCAISDEDMANFRVEINRILKDNGGKIIWRIHNLEETLSLNTTRRGQILEELEELRSILNILWAVEDDIFNTILY